jgi:hypothetical protein
VPDIGGTNQGNLPVAGGAEIETKGPEVKIGGLYRCQLGLARIALVPVCLARSRPLASKPVLDRRQKLYTYISSVCITQVREFWPTGDMLACYPPDSSKLHLPVGTKSGEWSGDLEMDTTSPSSRAPASRLLGTCVSPRRSDQHTVELDPVTRMGKGKVDGAILRWITIGFPEYPACSEIIRRSTLTKSGISRQWKQTNKEREPEMAGPIDLHLLDRA